MLSSTRAQAPHRLVVVGAGAAGTMVVIHAAEEAVRRRRPVRITLVDPGPRTGAGVAFATDDPRHLLNVPAGNMSCLPDRPGHFVDWLVANRDATATARSFVPRRHYGDYLAATSAAAVDRAGDLVTHRRLHTRATACAWHGDRARLTLADGSRLTADSVVLATGPLAARSPWATPELRASKRFVSDPWAPDALTGPLADDADVLLVGSGLTAVDVALTLARPGRTVHVLSRHGLLPRAHAVAPLPPVTPTEPLEGLPLRPLRAAVLRHIREVTRAHGDWRPAVDGLRPLTARLWGALGDEQRAEFLRTDRSRWNVARHRMAPETAEAVSRLRAARRLRLHVGDAADTRIDPDALTFTPEGSAPVRVGWVVDCSGPGLRPAASDDPLLTCLLSSGLALPGPLGMGFATTPGGQLRSRDGYRSMWTLGAHRRGELWETTAVPEIRQQAADIARSILCAARTDSAPAVAADTPVVVASPPSARVRHRTGCTVWLTGLPSAGKSSVARELATRLRSEGHRVEVLDGDEMRSSLSTGLGFSREDRDTHVRRVGMVAEVLARNGVIALVPVIAPYRANRESVRLRHDLARIPYLEIHVAAPVEVCSVRDVKGLYAKQAAG
ncbi:adenylyl-sulfate kinase, partial [Streptomyces sp. SID10115]|nr:adenylyl-sulfate kinase [Streptomyces sp. SID10115]